MAIEDGYVIAQALHKFADVPEALRQFEQARVARTNEIVAKSTENGRRFHNPELADEQEPTLMSTASGAKTKCWPATTGCSATAWTKFLPKAWA